jgi:hypothetical protein
MAPPPPVDCLNSLARVAVGKPVFFLTREIQGLDQIMPEFGIGVPFYPNRSETNFALFVPGMAYFEVVSFSESTATNPISSGPSAGGPSNAHQAYSNSRRRKPTWCSGP